MTVPWLKTDTFSVVLSLQTHLLAFADWMLDFLRPYWQYMFFRKKKLSRVSRVPFIGKDFPCFVILGPFCLKGAWLSGALELDRCAGCFLRESQGREYTGARRQKLSKYWSLMYQTMFDWSQWKHLSLWSCVEKTLCIHIQQMKLMPLCLFCMFEKATHFFLFLLVFLDKIWHWILC